MRWRAARRSSGSVAEPWKFTVCPCDTAVPLTGAAMVGVGGMLPTVTDRVRLAECPALFVTVSVGARVTGDADV